jgi:hypothetical protein
VYDFLPTYTLKCVKKNPKKNPKKEVETGTSRDETGKEKRSNHVQTFYLILLIITDKKRKEKDSIPSDHQCTVK